MDSKLWSELFRRLEENAPVAVATIATSDGSTPRSAGAKMLVGPHGLVAGSLGGGLAEARAIDAAGQSLADGKRRLFTIDMGGSAADGADLICGGVVQILVERLRPEFGDVYLALRERMRLGRETSLMTPLDGDGPPVLVTPENRPAGLTRALPESPDAPVVVDVDGRGYLYEPLPSRVWVVLAGGGHVSLATARMAAWVDFDVLAMDDRAEFVAPERFPWLPPDRLKVVPEYRNCLEEAVLGFPVTERTAVAIMTRGHSHDTDVLAQALATPAGYIGMIGSRRKKAAVYDAMRGRGFADDALARIHSPIGLAIGAQTPEEIAVSIVAQLIEVRAKALHG